MKRKTDSFTGQRPVFTGSPSIVPGGFNLDVTNQRFNVGDIIPIGTVAKFDEQTRLVQILKTAEVVDIDSDDAKIVSLKVAEFFKPVFCVGDKIAKAGAISGTYANAISITAINKTKSTYVITLSSAISGLAVGDTLEEVVENASHNAAERFTGNSVTIKRPLLTYALIRCNTPSWRGVCLRSPQARKMPLAWLWLVIRISSCLSRTNPLMRLRNGINIPNFQGLAQEWCSP